MRLRRKLIYTLAIWSGAILLPLAGTASTVYASGDASFSLSTSGSTTVGSTLTLTIDFTSQSSDGANSAEATITYPTSQLQWQSNAGIGSFNPNGDGLCPGRANSGGSGTATIACATTDTLSGTTQFATMSFAVVGSGSATIGMEATSDIDNGSGSSVWNGTYPSTGVTLSAAAQQSSGGSSTTSGGSSSKSSSGSGSSSDSNKSSSPSSSSTSPSTPSSSSSKTATTPTTQTSSGASSTASLNSTLSVAVSNSTDQPVDGAKVTVDNKYTAYTDAQGYATFSDIASGDHDVTVTKSGQTSTQSVSVPKGQTKSVSLKLASAKSSDDVAFLYVIVGIIILGAGGFGAMKFLKPKVRKVVPQSSGSGVVVMPRGTPVPTEPIRTASIDTVTPTVPNTPPASPNPPSVGTDVSAPSSSGPGQNSGNPPTFGS